MQRRRFFVARERIRDGVAYFPPDEAHHLRDVLRVEVGEHVEIFDGEGGVFSGRVESLLPEVRVGSLEVVDSVAGPGFRIVLAPALIKLDRFEWILQKGTELGVARFIPLETKFSGISIAGSRLEKRLERWRRIVREAAKQSRRATVPDIVPPERARRFFRNEEFDSCSRFLFYEKAESRLDFPIAAREPVLLCTGPEGGWAPEEVREAADSGYSVVGLGPAILRAETAALAVVALFHFFLSSNARS